jgi:MFS family permease
MSAGAGYRDLFRGNADFRNLWCGHVISLFGDWFNLIASASLVASLTGSGLAVGGLFVVRMLAPFLVSPIAGVAADRYDKRTLLIATDLVRFVVVLGFLLVREPSQVWLLYALTFVQLAMHGIFFPTRNAMLPEIVSPRELGAANAVTAATWSVMLATGAAAGGLVSGSFGVYPAFVVDSLTFLVSAFFIARVRSRRAPPTEGAHPSAQRALADYVEGLRYLGSHADVLAIVLNKAALTLFVAGAYEVVQVALARDVYVIGEGGGTSLVCRDGRGAVSAGGAPELRLGPRRRHDSRDGRRNRLGLLDAAPAGVRPPRGARPGLRHRVRPFDPRHGGERRPRRTRPRPRGAPTGGAASDDGGLDPGPGGPLGSLASPTLRKILGTLEGPFFV